MVSLPNTAGQSIYANPTPAGAPKEIGIMQRLDGVRSGVSEIEYQVRSLITALQGGPTEAPSPTTAVSQPGIHGSISDTEASIRETMRMIRQLADTF